MYPVGLFFFVLQKQIVVCPTVTQKMYKLDKFEFRKVKKKIIIIQHQVTSQQESKFQSWNEMADDDAGGVEVRRL